jgi:hypothetical protein
LSSGAVHVDLPWAVLVGAAGRPVLDREGRPKAIELSSRTSGVLEPINTQWLTPDAKNPARRRILFETREDGHTDRR